MKNRFAIPDSKLRTVALAIKIRRRELYLTQEALAEKANMHRTYMSLIERNTSNITMKMFFELAYALELSPTELLKLASSWGEPRSKSRNQKLSDIRLHLEPLTKAASNKAAGRKPRGQLNLALSKNQLDRFNQYANKKQIPASILAKAWILERLDNEAKEA
jgi:transcriptional regulator with XRE-family HTH domain